MSAHSYDNANMYALSAATHSVNQDKRHQDHHLNNSLCLLEILYEPKSRQTINSKTDSMIQARDI